MDSEQDEQELNARLVEAELTVSALNERIRRDWRNPTDRHVQMACDDLRLVAAFIHGYTPPDLPAFVRGALGHDKDFVEAFELIHILSDEFSGCLLAIGQSGPESRFVAKLTGLASDMCQALDEAVRAFVAVVQDGLSREAAASVRPKAMGLVSDVRNQLQARQLIREAGQALGQAEHALDETLRVRDATKKVAGEVGADSFGAEYEQYANRETQVADRLRWSVAFLLVTVVACAVAFAVWMDDVSLRTEVIRLSVTIPLAVLAGYLARESAKHRAAARGARDLAIAMHTLPTYTEPLDEIGRDLRRVLGMRAFGVPGYQLPTKEGDGLYADPAKLLERLEEIVRRGREVADGQTNSPREP